jgi:hypothetical protein
MDDRRRSLAFFFSKGSAVSLEANVQLEMMYQIQFLLSDFVLSDLSLIILEYTTFEGVSLCTSLLLNRWFKLGKDGFDASTIGSDTLVFIIREFFPSMSWDYLCRSLSFSSDYPFLLEPSLVAEEQDRFLKFVAIASNFIIQHQCVFIWHCRELFHFKLLIEVLDMLGLLKNEDEVLSCLWDANFIQCANWFKTHKKFNLLRSVQHIVDKHLESSALSERLSWLDDNDNFPKELVLRQALFDPAVQTRNVPVLKWLLKHGCMPTIKCWKRVKQNSELTKLFQPYTHYKTIERLREEGAKKNIMCTTTQHK